MAEAAKNICMERLMARVTVVVGRKKVESNEAQRRAEQITDRLCSTTMYNNVYIKSSNVILDSILGILGFL